MHAVNLNLIFEPTGLLTWLIIGLIAGSLASLVIRGHGYGCFGNIVIGLVGAVIGGVIASFLDLGQFHFWGTVFIAFLGSCVLVLLLQAISGNRSKR